MNNIKNVSITTAPGKGRGVFAKAKFCAGTLIEISEIIVIPAHQRTLLDSTVLYDYYFSWGTDHSEAAIALGYGSLYNHSYHPNARYQKDIETQTIHFFALKDIAEGDEITVNYNGHPESTEPLWFDAIEDSVKHNK